MMLPIPTSEEKTWIVDTLGRRVGSLVNILHCTSANRRGSREPGERQSWFLMFLKTFFGGRVLWHPRQTGVAMGPKVRGRSSIINWNIFLEKLFCSVWWGVCGTGCAVTQSETFMKENDLNLDETRLHPSPLPPWCPWQPPCTCQPPRWSGSYRAGLICRGLLGPDSLIVGHDNLCQDCQIFHKQHSEIAVKCQENVIFCTWATISSTNSFFSPPTCSKPCIYELGLDFGWNGSFGG